MSTQTITKKRKSVDGDTTTTKKVKTTTSAERPAPLKSALKKTKSTSIVDEAVPSDAVAAARTSEEKKVATQPELTPDQTAALLAGFSSDEEDSASEDEAGIAVEKLPKAPTTGEAQKKINQAVATQKKGSNGEDDSETTPGVIYIGRIPHGFYEHQMRAYFSQFGEILHLRLMRNRKTGRSQHYGFMEFASAAVADIVCKTMDKYLLFGHLLQVRRVPREQVNENMWRKSSRKARNVAPRNRLEGTYLRKGATREVWEARVVREQKKRANKAEKLKEMGFEFDMPAVKSVHEVPVKSKAIEEVQVGAEDSTAVDDGVSIEAEPAEPAASTLVAEEKISKKRSASGKTQTKKAIKKVKA